jgi:hypothetical protein
MCPFVLTSNKVCLSSLARHFGPVIKTALLRHSSRSRRSIGWDRDHLGFTFRVSLCITCVYLLLFFCNSCICFTCMCSPRNVFSLLLSFKCQSAIAASNSDLSCSSSALSFVYFHPCNFFCFATPNRSLKPLCGLNTPNVTYSGLIFQPYFNPARDGRGSKVPNCWKYCPLTWCIGGMRVVFCTVHVDTYDALTFLIWVW